MGSDMDSLGFQFPAKAFRFCRNTSRSSFLPDSGFLQIRFLSDPAADHQRLLLLKLPQHRFHRLPVITFQPQLQDPPGHGILHGKQLRGVFWIRYPIQPGSRGPENPVYKSPQARKAFFDCQLDSLIADRRIRHCVHVFELIDRARRILRITDFIF